MRVTRIYQNQSLARGQCLTLDQAASHHVKSVLRQKAGDTLCIFNGQGGEYTGIIQSLSRHEVRVMLNEYHERDTESPLQTHLGQAISRGDKMDFSIQKAVEMGVTEITPLFTERCGVSLLGDRLQKRLQHWQSVAISAAEQSGRTGLATIHEPCSLIDWCASQTSGARVMLEPSSHKRMQDIEVGREFTFLVGPEGGFSSTEVNQVLAHGFDSIRLGPRVLRTESVALTIMALAQYAYGDLNG